MAQEPATLREQLEANYDKIVAPSLEEEQPSTAVVTADAVVETQASETTEQREQRERDEAGRFVKKDDAPKAEAAPRQKPEPQQRQEAQPVPQPKPDKIGAKRPDSWKKEVWPIWDKLDAGETLTKEERKLLLEYLPQREGEFQRGVATYAAEARAAKPILEALAPYQPFMQQNGLTPDALVSRLIQTDQVFRFGSEQDKLATLARFVQDYQIPIHQMLIQGEDGKVYFNQQYFQQQQQQTPQYLTPEQARQIAREEQQYTVWQTAIIDMASAKDNAGNPLYPHFDEFRTTMDGLLRSGAVRGATPKEALENAYQTTLRLPQHQHLFDAQQTAKREADEAQKRREDAERAARARSNAVSPRPMAPTGQLNGGGKKDLRAALEESYEKHVAGRI